MGTGAITQYVDVAQLVLYLFWIFFAGLIYYLARENHREGYPMEVESGRGVIGGWPVPPPKTFLLPFRGEKQVPSPDDVQPLISAEPAHRFVGAPLVPVGDPMFAGIGPGAIARRADVVDVGPDGQPRLRPLREVPDFGVAAASRDPRGLDVVGADGVVGGRVFDLWVDTIEDIFRYIEVETPSPTGPRRVLLPITFARIGRDEVRVQAILGAQFSTAPAPRQPDKVTLLEEEKIGAYYGAGTLYAEPGRAEPLL